jgi:hypothetical protein
MACSVAQCRLLQSKRLVNELRTTFSIRPFRFVLVALCQLNLELSARSELSLVYDSRGSLGGLLDASDCRMAHRHLALLAVSKLQRLRKKNGLMGGRHQ